MVVLLVGCALLTQAPDPAYEPLSKAYEALRNRVYHEAIAGFLKALDAAPGRVAVRKDLAYTYLKIGENEAARDQFRESMRLEPADFHVALEYAFLCNETKEQAQARRIFDRVRKTGDPQSRATAEQAFRNIDEPLEQGIARWKRAIEMGAENFSAHYELATLAERRDELELAAEQYEKAWRLIPDRRGVLVDLGRTWRALNRIPQANAALLAASRGGEPRAAEAARELLPARYPFVPEFRAALGVDPANVELRRELAYLLLRMDRQAEAEQEFVIITRSDENDLLSAAQLGFLYLGRGDRLNAMPLLERVLRGNDEELANRVRAVLRMPQTLRKRPEEPAAEAIGAKEMAERSIRAGYLKDALKYLQMAHEADPADFNVMLKLGWTYNNLRDDGMAVRWFNVARRSPDPKIASEAARGYNSLRQGLARVRTSGWTFPIYSSRWRDFFSYGQVKTELRLKAPVTPYASVRFIGDTRRTLGGSLPQYLSESSVILGVGLASRAWHGITTWGEAGTAVGYLTGHVLPDYRGGVVWGRGFKKAGFFFETAADGVFLSRFDNDFLVYSQTRYGYTPNFGPLKMQLYFGSNVTVDARREYWANFVELGPGVKFRYTPLSESTYFTVNVLRGVYLRNAGNPRRPNYFDFRAGFGYAFAY